MNVFYNLIEQYGFSIVEESGKYGVVDAQNNVLIDVVYNYIFAPKNGYSLMIKDSKYGVMDTTPAIVVPVECSSVEEFPPDILNKLK